MRLIVTNVPWSACLSIEITFGIWTYAAQGPMCYMGSRSPAGKGTLGSLRSIEKIYIGVSLPDYLRHPSRSFHSLGRELKTFLFSFY